MRKAFAVALLGMLAACAEKKPAVDTAKATMAPVTPAPESLRAAPDTTKKRPPS